MTNPRQIDNYLRSQGSPLAGLGNVFVREARRNRFDPLLLVAIAGAESQFGRQVKAGTHNPFGWGPHIPFQSWEQAITRVARGLRTGYLDEGLKTIKAIGGKWAPIGAGNDPTGLNNNWSANVAEFYRDLGGTGIKSGSGMTMPTIPGDAGMPTPFDPLTGMAPDPLGEAARLNLAEIGTGNSDVLGQNLRLLQAFGERRRADALGPLTMPGAPAAASPQPMASGDWSKWVRVPPARGTTSQPTRPVVLQFVAGIAQDFGQPLDVWDNTTHSLTTVNKKPSAHGPGWAVDVPATGAKLRRLGYIALVRAGMDPAEARKASRQGGLWNLNGYQIIFATQIGGNHDDHLHLGFAPARQTTPKRKGGR